MRLIKSFNNNALVAEDENGTETVLLGKGIAFGKKPGDMVDENKIQKQFYPSAQELNEKFEHLFQEIPVQYLQLTTEIVEMAEKELGYTFSPMGYLGLSDHISYAVRRYREGHILRNPMLWDIRKFYPDQFRLAQRALKMIGHETGIYMEEDEAAFITLHFVNVASENEPAGETLKTVKIIRDILQITEYHYQIKLDENSMSYSRFLTHLQYFVRRLDGAQYADSDDSALFLQISRKYPAAYACVLKVQNYLESVQNIEMTQDEMVYFMLHVNRVVNSSLPQKQSLKTSKKSDPNDQ